MFGWGKRKREMQIVEDVCERIRPQLMILERQLGDYPRALADDPFVIGYIVAASTIFCHIETNGKASREMIGLASLAALRVMFAPFGFTTEQASAAMHAHAQAPAAKQGARAADLIIGVAAGKTDRAHEPEIVEAKTTVATMSDAVREASGPTSARGLLLQVLTDQMLYAPLGKYKRFPD